MRNNLFEFRGESRPIGQNRLGLETCRFLKMLGDERFQKLQIAGISDILNGDHLLIDPGLEKPVLVQHISKSTAHARREIFTREAKHQHNSIGHVLTAVIPRAFDHGGRSTIPNSETFPRPAQCMESSSGRPVKNRVSNDHILIHNVTGIRRRSHNNFPTTHAFADIVIGLAAENDFDPLGQKMRRDFAPRCL